MQLRQALIDFSFGVQRKSYSLAAVTAVLATPTQPDKSSPWRLRYSELDGLPVAAYPADALRYSLEDALCTLEAHQIQEQWRARSPHFGGADALRSQCHEARGALALVDVANEGLHADPATARAFRGWLEQRQSELLDALIPAGLVTREVKKDLPKLRARLTALGEARPTASGGVSLARRTLLRSDDPDVRAFADWPASAEYLAAQGYATARWKRDTGVAQSRMTRAPHPQASLDNDACEQSGDPVLKAYAEYSAVAKTLSTDLPLIERAASAPLHAYYRPIQSTGRTSTGRESESSTKGNVQNMPRRPGVCECYCPPPGHVFVDVDYPAIELRTFAQIALWTCGFSQLATDLNAGVDPHMRVAAAILGWPYEQAAARKGEAVVKAARTAGKGVNFGRKGRMGAKRFVEYCWNNYRVRLGEGLTHELEQKLWAEFCRKHKLANGAAPEALRGAWDEFRPVAHAQHLIDLHDALTPEFGAYSQWALSHVRPGTAGREALFDLRHPITGRLRAGLGFTDIHNYPFQGLAVDVAKAALFELTCASRRAGDAFEGCRVALFVHDSFTAHAPAERAQSAAKRMAEIVGGVAKAWLPGVNTPCEANILTRLSKHAESSDPVRLPDGSIRIWDPWERCAAAATAATEKGLDVAAELQRQKWPPYVALDALRARGQG